MTIMWEDFERVKLRVGTVVAAEPNPLGRKPAYVLEVDLGDVVLRHPHLECPDHRTLCGRRAGGTTGAVRVCNFEPKRIAGVKSEVLVTGAYDTEGRVVLAGFDLPVPNGTRLC